MGGGVPSSSGGGGGSMGEAWRGRAGRTWSTGARARQHLAGTPEGFLLLLSRRDWGGWMWETQAGAIVVPLLSSPSKLHDPPQGGHTHSESGVGDVSQGMRSFFLTCRFQSLHNWDAGLQTVRISKINRLFEFPRSPYFLLLGTTQTIQQITSIKTKPKLIYLLSPYQTTVLKRS